MCQCLCKQFFCFFKVNLIILSVYIMIKYFDDKSKTCFGMWQIIKLGHTDFKYMYYFCEKSTDVQ